MRVLMSSSPHALAAALAPFALTATVEAEYGDRVAPGTLATLAHHGPRASEPCPCSEAAYHGLRPHRRINLGGSRSGPVGGVLARPCEAHAPHAETQCPDCWQWCDVEAIGLSHLDLDALGGVAALLDRRPTAPLFWALAAAVDVRGPHRLAEEVDRLALFEADRLEGNAIHDSEASGGACVPWPRESYLADGRRAAEEAARQIRAWWAWSRDNRVMAPRDGGVADATALVEQALRALAVLLGDPSEERAAMLAAGAALATNEEVLEARSWVRAEGGVAVRISDRFVNALYAHEGTAVNCRAPGGCACRGEDGPCDMEYLPWRRVYRAVAALNTATGQINLSLADPVPGVSCRAIVQALWGPEAGGHDGIAGSPRGRAMTRDDLDRAARALAEALMALEASRG